MKALSSRSSTRRAASAGLLAAIAWFATAPTVQDPERPKAPAAEAPAEPRMPQVGEPLPRFRLNDHDGRAVAVGGKAEHWTVVAFYPKAATPG